MITNIINAIHLQIDGVLRDIKENLDIIAGFSGVLLGLIIIALYYIAGLHQIDIGFTVLFASVLYIIIRNKIGVPLSIDFIPNRKIKLSLDIIFYLFFILSIFLLSNELYGRPLSYFIIISLLAGIIAIEIITSEKNQLNSILFKIILLSLNIKVGIYYKLPGILGYDAYQHARIAELITNYGSIPAIEISNKYYYYALSHILMALTQILSNISIKDAMFWSISLSSIIVSILICYSISNLTTIRVGLLATLLINITHDVIVTELTNITAGSLVFIYFILIFYFLLNRRNEFISASLIIFLTLLMVLTHQLTTFVVLVCMTFIYLSKKIYIVTNNVPLINNRLNLNIWYMLLFLVALREYWDNTFLIDGESFFHYVAKPFLEELLLSGPNYGSNYLILGYQYNLGFYNYLMLHLSYLILPFFGIGGILFWLSLRDVTKFSIAITSILLYLIIYGVPVFGIRNFLTDRWMPFLSLFLVIMASDYIFKLTQLANSKLVLFIIIFFVSFFMITTPAINKDSPLVSKNTTVRTQFDDNEIYSAKTISKFPTGRILTDLPYTAAFTLYGINETLLDQRENMSLVKNFNSNYIDNTSPSENGLLIILRKCLLEEPCQVQYLNLYGATRAQFLPQSFFSRFNSIDYDFIYNSGQIFTYAPTYK